MQHKFPGGPIPSSLAKAMIEEYKTKRSDLIKEQLGIDDARKVWFSKKTIDAIFKAAGATEENSDKFGLEIHYGVVPQERQGVGIPDDYVGLHNVVLMATNEDVTTSSEDEKDSYDWGSLCPPSC
jgi:hypothetical protein